MREKRILHLDMDAFFASIEQAANPRLKGLPLIVGGRMDRKRTVVCAASYEAKRFGIDSGMSCKEAFRLCPEAEFVVADSSKYLYVSSEIFKLLQNYSPQVEQASVDEFYLDITGCDKFFGTYFNLAMDIKEKIKENFDITGSIGITINRLIAKIASKLKKPDGLVILEKKDIDKVLADLPIEKIPGIGKSLTEHLHNLSIFSFKDLQKYPEDFFAEKFGKIGLWIYRAAHPQQDEADISFFVQKESIPKSVGHSYTLPKNIYTSQEIEAWINLLCEMVGFRLRRNNLASTTVHVYLRKPNLEFMGKEKNFKEPTNDSQVLFRRVLFILDKLNFRNNAVRALGVTARNLTQAAYNCLFTYQEKRNKVLKAQDKINERFGDWTLYPASICTIKDGF